MHNDLVLSDLGRKVTRMTDYLSAKRVWDPFTQGYISVKCAYQKFVTQPFQWGTRLSEISSLNDYKW